MSRVGNPKAMRLEKARKTMRGLVNKGVRINPRTASNYYRGLVSGTGKKAERQMSKISDKVARGKM